MDQTLLENIKTILENAKDMTIATVRDDGFPQATTVTYVNDGLTIYFACDPNAQKAKNIARNSKVSITVNLDYGDWNEIKGLSIGAWAERITDPEEMNKAGQLMYEKFPQIKDYVSDESDNFALFRVAPKVISLLDYSKGFGHTDLVELA